MSPALPRAAALLLALGCAAPMPTPPERVADGRYAMGTVLEITLHGPDPVELGQARDEAFALASRLEALMSSYDPQSQLSRLNDAAGGEPLRVDPELARLLRRSVALAELTRGSFDVSVGPLVELWRDAAERGEPPAAADIEGARRRVGAQHLRVHPDGRAELPRAGMAVDLGGVAKGYALDRMRERLRERGVESALLSFGQSSVWGVGAPPGSPGWRLLVRGPGEDFLGVLTLRDQALSVSGSLGQWLEIAGRRYGHVIDPRSGRPLTRRRQTHVVAPDATLAEALSKALLVLGEAEGLALVGSQPGCEGLLVDADGGVWSTPGWGREVAYEPLP